MGVGPSTSRSPHPCRLRDPKIRYFNPLSRIKLRHSRKPPLFLLPLPLRPRILGFRILRLLRLLPRKHTKVETLPLHSFWHGTSCYF